MLACCVLTANKSNLICVCETYSCNVWDLYPKRNSKLCLVCTKVWSYFEWAKCKLMGFVFCNNAVVETKWGSRSAVQEQR